MVIPRENKLVRLYIQLTEVVKEDGQVDRSKITPDQILKAAQKTIAPYKLDYQYCDWWTAYQIGQRVGTSFHSHSRVFLAGDAVHTHSPKAGQGMNVSMQDAYNLTWKIGLAVKGLAKRSILPTYQSERRRIAHDLIAFDHKFSRLFSGRPAKDEADGAGISMIEFKEVFKRGHFFASGLSVDYGSSILVAKPGDAITEGDGTDVSSHSAHKVVGKQDLAHNIKLGMRIPSYKVLNQSDGRPWHFQERLPSDGRFRLVVFAGNIGAQAQLARYQALGKALSAPSSFLKKFTPKGQKIDSVIEVLTVHSTPRHDIELLDLPEIFHPFDDRLGWDYEKVFVDDMSYHEGHGEAYLNYGIEHETGCLVVLRPDQYVGYIGDLEDVEEVKRYFEEILVAQQ
jgi:phenol 2-monooxygenase